LKNLEYAYLQLGEQGKAREVMGKIGKLAVEPGGDPWSAVDARIYFDVDTHDWNDAVGNNSTISCSAVSKLPDRRSHSARSSHRLNINSYWLPQSVSSKSAMPAKKYARADV
jgi:hypothetical protein